MKRLLLLLLAGSILVGCDDSSTSPSKSAATSEDTPDKPTTPKDVAIDIYHARGTWWDSSATEARKMFVILGTKGDTISEGAYESDGTLAAVTECYGKFQFVRYSVSLQYAIMFGGSCSIYSMEDPENPALLRSWTEGRMFPVSGYSSTGGWTWQWAGATYTMDALE